MSHQMEVEFYGAAMVGAHGSVVTDVLRVECSSDGDTFTLTTQDATLMLTAEGAQELAEFILRNPPDA
ncbi:MAG: hypothetical protein LC798_13580 [Chloroflexi bacterium]|nr:hypothetical protein [Chloroflexota bacterium]